MKAADRLVFPLDLPSAGEARRYIRLLAGHMGMFKLGLELFIEGGPDMVRMIKEESGARVFLDLKLHDIPATVGRAVSRCRDLGVDFLTVHCGENPHMLRSAVENAGNGLGILGVTVLTSVDRDHLASAGYTPEFQNPRRLVRLRAESAREAGCAGIVCSGWEAGAVKKACGTDFITMVPGIRPDWGRRTKDDQKRIVTPSAAMRNGADYLVVGRPVRDAPDPAAAADRIITELEQAELDLAGQDKAAKNIAGIS
ncbi:MAG: orotidine-5'-phosphate decarboxylase [Desulfobacterales bacterium]|nr:MAG: orotidine-5'-phosphate decarboxylase [Desulfobacterales bacterium]